jgi:hypothetical protein
MPARTFRDVNGIEWRVCTTTSALRDDTVIPEWLLTFESGSARRQLRPIPRGWETAPTQRLEQMCRIADPVDRRQILAELKAAEATRGGLDSAGLPSSETLGSTDVPANSLRADRSKPVPYGWVPPNSQTSYRG